MALSGATIACFLVLLDVSIIATAIPQITSEFQSLLDVGWYGSAYQLTSSAFQPFSGKIYAHFSTKWSFLTFFFLFELGSLLCGAAQNSVMLIVGRAVAGIGSSGLINGGLTIVSACLPVHKQPAATGILISFTQLGIALGPLLGGAFTEDVSWRWCFYINLPIGAIVAGFIVLIDIPESTRKLPVRQVLNTAFSSLDLIGLAIFTPSAIMFFLALSWGGNDYAWGSATIIGLFCGSFVTIIIFLLWERRKGDSAMVPFSMLRTRIIWSVSSTMFFFAGVLFCANYYLPIYLQTVKGKSPIQSGVNMLPIVLFQVMMAIVSGVSVQKFGFYLPFVLAGTSITAIGYGLYSTLDPTSSMGHWVGFEIVFGVGAGCAGAMAFIALQTSIPAAQISIAMGILLFFQNLGGAIWLSIAQIILTSSLRTSIPHYAPNVDTDAVIAAGASSVRLVASGEDLKGVLLAYSRSINRVMYLGVGLAIGALVCGWWMGWRDVRVKKVVGDDVAEERVEGRNVSGSGSEKIDGDVTV
ncbi:putative MFS transporter [Rhexocercosporidium sp. MPI-PUGE-AT-0058]|nr:putative MFS transporter [Rhexocercosporidium sp. MPI-PUGE-AT-0058]